MKDYIIDATKQLKTSINKENIDRVAIELEKISKAVKNIEMIGLRGGAAVDIIKGLEPNDIDLIYSYKKEGEISHECHCDEVRDKIKRVDLDLFKKFHVDLENVYEKEPYLNPIQRTVGLFSYHTEYYSQFYIDKEGRVWTNKNTLSNFLNDVFEIRYEGYLPWAYYPRKGDSMNYWTFQALMIIRGIGYVLDRKLKPGDKFLELLEQHSLVISNSIENNGLDRMIKYAQSKVKSKERFSEFVNKHIEKEQHKDIYNSFGSIVSRLK